MDGYLQVPPLRHLHLRRLHPRHYYLRRYHRCQHIYHPQLLHPISPFLLHPPLHPHQYNSHYRQEIEPSSLSLTKAKSPLIHGQNQMPRRSPLLRGLTTPHTTRHLTSDYLQVTDPI